MAEATKQGLMVASLRGYQRSWLRPDVVAGLTVWAVLVPESLAYATIAGVSPVVGLYAAAPTLVLYAVAGSSRHLVVGPMSSTAALSAAMVAPFAGSDLGRFAALTSAIAIVMGLDAHECPRPGALRAYLPAANPGRRPVPAIAPTAHG
jgi:sulfate permease, SulP family